MQFSTISLDLSLLYWLQSKNVHWFNWIGLFHKQPVVLEGSLSFKDCSVFYSFSSWAASSSHCYWTSSSSRAAPGETTQWLMVKEPGKILLSASLVHLCSCDFRLVFFFFSVIKCNHNKYIRYKIISYLIKGIQLNCPCLCGSVFFFAGKVSL